MIISYQKLLFQSIIPAGTVKMVVQNVKLTRINRLRSTFLLLVRAEGNILGKYYLLFGKAKVYSLQSVRMWPT